MAAWCGRQGRRIGSGDASVLCGPKLAGTNYSSCFDGKSTDCRDEVSDRLQLIRMDFTDCCRQNEAGVNVPKLSLSNRTYLIRKANAIRQEQQNVLATKILIIYYSCDQLRKAHFCAYERELRKQVELTEAQSQVLQSRLTALRDANLQIRTRTYIEQSKGLQANQNMELKQKMQDLTNTLAEQRHLYESNVKKLILIDDQKATEEAFIRERISEINKSESICRTQHEEKWVAFCEALQLGVKERQQAIDMELKDYQKRIYKEHARCRELKRIEESQFEEKERTRLASIRRLKLTRERLLENLNLKRSKITADAGTAQDRKFWEKVVDNLSQNRRDRSRIDTEQRELLGLIEDCD
ncbi:uncharacterized protein LOC111250097 isoform X1 [Varroa destructor]|uniref:Uncharacterized protein n=1 Tax=Varroa destructor TaxID=109461 RepID=A0A7M7K507_VARDE|nr:uncharacterized protein LOC111250097 isoform X1 [Varroa destructor]XP_022660519.1 uncharacterized protein LOC111250097 isoform X1 [Varroa destructor]XP_022660520.1 uncharacterized protein LOC111250097 isoform X1 [Varroa destructor]XP_022660522.1 uncharacterized protein LOC111250097 isoform X1 [Varroa destructor]XP_022660523.1 uncharacterized protein LOC111250097 isoform X1 [Varroa destructor]